MSAAPARVEQIVVSWTLTDDFGMDRDQPEGDFASRVSATGLSADLGAIGSPLSTDSVDWPGYASRPLVRSLTRDFSGKYVALLRMGSLDRVVNRAAITADIAASVA